jgi:hypothetical protein
MLGILFGRVDITLNDHSFKLCIGMIKFNLGVKRLIDTMDVGYGVGLNCTLGNDVTYGVGSVSGEWHVNMMIHLFVGRYVWYKRL